MTPADQGRVVLELAKALQFRQGQGHSWASLTRSVRLRWLARAVLVLEECPTLAGAVLGHAGRASVPTLAGWAVLAENGR